MIMAPYRHFADNISPWFVGSQHVPLNLPPTMYRDYAMSRTAQSSKPETGESYQKDFRYPSFPSSSVSGGAILSRYPIARDMAMPKLHWSHNFGTPKNLPRKVSQEVKHTIGRSAIMFPPRAFHMTSASAAAQLKVDAADTKNKRPTRKCKVENCPNSVVQGGLCISHGAKRKLCAHPGCSKNVKKAGMCSAHGPARKRCEHSNCNNIAVQGGLCITHGAKKRLCSSTGCTKKARSSWNHMCKRHYDESLPDPSNQMPLILPILAHSSAPIQVAQKPQCYNIVPNVAEA